MAAIGYRYTGPEMADTQHTTLRKILARLSQELEIASGFSSVVENISQDAFGRVRVSNPVTELEAKHTLTTTREWSDVTAGSGTVTYAAASSSCLLDIDLSLGGSGSVAHQTMRRAYYQPGKSQLCLMTFALTSQLPEAAAAFKAQLSWDVGMGDASTGVFFSGNGRPDDTLSDVGFSVRGLINSTAARSAWSVDKLDGSGPSGKTVQFFNRTHIVWFDAEWLGVGDVRCGFVLDGEFVHCHTFKHNNTDGNVTPYTHSMNFPMRWSMQSLAISGGGKPQLAAICGSIISEGGREKLGYPYCARRSTALATLNDTDWYALIGIRLNYATDSRARYAIIEPSSLSVASDNALFEVGLFRAPTISGTPTWATLSPGVQAAVATTSANKITAGSPINSAVASGTNQATSFSVDVSRDFRLGIDINNTPEPLWLGVRKLVGNFTNFYGTLNYRENL